MFGIPPSPQPAAYQAPAPTVQLAPMGSAKTSLTVADRFTGSSVTTPGATLPVRRDPVSTSMLSPDASWAQDAVAQEFRALGVGFRPKVVVDRTSYVDDHSDVVHLARFKFSPTLRKVTQSAMVDTTFMHLIRHETAHAFFNLTWKPQLAPSFAAAFGPHDAPYEIGVIDQALSGIKRKERPEFVSDYAQEHPAEDFAETVAVYLRFKGDAAGLDRYIQAKGNSPVLRRKFDYVARLVARNRCEFP
jgi:hypothetical protein